MHRGVEHHERGVGGCLGGERGESLVEVARHDARRVGGGDARGRLQPVRRSSCSGQMSASSQARSSVRVTSSGLRSMPGAPDDLGQAIGHGHRPRDGAVEHDLARPVGRIELRMPRIPVAVAVGVQAQTGGCPDLEQRDGPVDAGECRNVQCAARGLVRLRGVGKGGGTHFGPVRVQPVAEELVRRRRGAPMEACRREHEVRLPLRGRQLVDEGDRARVIRHSERPCLVRGGHSPRLDLGERSISLGGGSVGVDAGAHTAHRTAAAVGGQRRAGDPTRTGGRTVR